MFEKQNLFLIYQLALKDLKVKYKNAYLGFSWTILVPLVMMLVFMVVFKIILRMELSPKFLLAGLFPWTFTTNCLMFGTSAYVDNMSILKKLYFPRYYITLSIVFSNMISFIISLILLSFFNINISFNLIYTIIPFTLQIIFTIGLCLIFGSLFVYFRDTKYFIEILLLVWFYLTPIFYSQKYVMEISKKALYLYLLNPMCGIIIMYRDIILNGILSNNRLILITSAEALITFIVGILIFKKLQGNFIDYA